MKLSEARQEDILYLQLWEAWQDKLIEAESTDQRDREAELLTAHFEEAGLRPPAKDSRYSLMFSAFVGGVQTVFSILK